MQIVWQRASWLAPMVLLVMSHTRLWSGFECDCPYGVEVSTTAGEIISSCKVVRQVLPEGKVLPIDIPCAAQVIDTLTVGSQDDSLRSGDASGPVDNQQHAGP